MTPKKAVRLQTFCLFILLTLANTCGIVNQEKPALDENISLTWMYPSDGAINHPNNKENSVLFAFFNFPESVPKRLTPKFDFGVSRFHFSLAYFFTPASIIGPSRFSSVMSNSQPGGMPLLRRRARILE